MSSKYVQPNILAFSALIKMNDYDKYQEKIKIKKKKIISLMSEISFIDYNIIKIIFFIKDVWSNSQTKLQKRS